MGWQIPIYNIKIDTNPRLLAFLKPTAAHVFDQELKSIYDNINSSLTAYFEDDEFEYIPENLRLYFLNASNDSFVIWQPETNIQESVSLLNGIAISKMESLTEIAITNIPENFPHVFWEKLDETTNNQPH